MRLIKEEVSGRPVILYHKNCADGFGSALAAYTQFGDTAAYIPVNYGEPVPSEIKPDDEIYIVDFSYARDVLENLAKSNKIQVIDHHKTAQEALKGLDYCIFDMDHSGAVLTWQHLFPDQPVPTLLQYIEDRDIWKWKLPNSRAISAWLSSYEFDFKIWSDLMETFDDQYNDVIPEGEAILRLQQLQINRLLESSVQVHNIGGKRGIPVVNSPLLRSELGEALLQKYPKSPFAGVYNEDSEYAYWSLRSRPDFDVTTIASQFGGGGHAQAAGYSIKLN